MPLKEIITKANREEELKKNPILALFDVIKGIGETKDMLERIFDRKVEPPVVNVEAPVVNIPAPIVNIPAPIVNVPEQVAPIVNVPAPIVNVEAPIINVPEQLAPIVNIDTKAFEEGIDTTNKTLKDIFDDLKARGLDIGKVQLVDKDGKPIDLTRMYSTGGLIGGRGYETVWVKGIDGVKRNVSTEEKQDTQITALNTLNTSVQGLASPAALLSANTFMFADVASDIATYKEMTALNSYVTAPLASIVTAGVSTTPTLLATLATSLGHPGQVTIPSGSFVGHIETKKTAGANNYYVYFEVYKRTAGGTETLIVTSDNSSQSALNTNIQWTMNAFLSSSLSLASTDRLVIKVYAVMVSSTATITFYYDDNTNTRLEIPYVTGVVTSIQQEYTTRYDKGATYTYLGKAAVGSLTTEPVWMIRRMTNADFTIIYADGHAHFDNIWDNRASLSYS